jgi:hypothetical protein
LACFLPAGYQSYREILRALVAVTAPHQHGTGSPKQVLSALQLAAGFHHAENKANSIADQSGGALPTSLCMRSGGAASRRLAAA